MDNTKTPTYPAYIPFDQAGDRQLRTHPRRKQEQPTANEWLIVDDPEISEVMCTETGKHHSARDVLGKDIADMMSLRMRVRTHLQNDPLYTCSICGVAVHICSSRNKRRFFFKHREQDGSCPANTAGDLTQDEINARKYNGAKESKLHRRMKDWITQCLELDERFDSAQQEARWKGALPAQWRKPDITARYGDMRVAFEIQLSTTPLSVIAARRIFYQAEGALLFWIFAEFEQDYRRLTEDDIFFSNNLNAFVVDQKTVDASVEAKEFRFECVWVQPMPSGELSGLHRRQLRFHDLTLQPDRQMAFWFDFEAARNAMRQKTEEETLREDIENWWLAEGPLGTESKRHAEWGQFQPRLQAVGVDVSVYFNDYFTTAKVLYCAKHGRAICDGRGTLIAIAHGVISTHKRDLKWFMRGIKVFGISERLDTQDANRKFSQARARAHKDYAIDPAPFLPPENCRALITFLFPEIAPLP
ncbi:MAG: DUF6035 family protein [Telluria sp.]